MQLDVTCPTCKRAFKVGEQHAGKQGRCPKCGGHFIIGRKSPGNAANEHFAATPPPAVPIPPAQLSTTANHAAPPASPPPIAAGPTATSFIKASVDHVFARGHRFPRSVTFAGALIVLLIGYFLGREHMKYELRSVLREGGKAFSAGMQESFAKPFGHKKDAAIVPAGVGHLGDTISVGDMQVKVVSAQLGHFKSDTPHPADEVGQLFLAVDIHNASTSIKFNFPGWTDPMHMTDDFGNLYGGGELPGLTHQNWRVLARAASS
jgi:DNA-directed RNA polymerase subunit RPC12/RpoP